MIKYVLVDVLVFCFVDAGVVMLSVAS